jgi:hypothetical protein
MDNIWEQLSKMGREDIEMVNEYTKRILKEDQIIELPEIQSTCAYLRKERKIEIEQETDIGDEMSVTSSES